MIPVPQGGGSAGQDLFEASLGRPCRKRRISAADGEDESRPAPGHMGGREAEGGSLCILETTGGVGEMVTDEGTS